MFYGDRKSADGGDFSLDLWGRSQYKNIYISRESQLLGLPARDLLTAMV